MNTNSTNHTINVSGTVLTIDEFCPASASRIWIKINSVKPGHQCTALPIYSFQPKMYKNLKPLDQVFVLGHIEVVKNSYSVLAVADAVIPLE